MPETIKQFATISRAEFLLPNLGSLIMGLAWGATSPLDTVNLIILIVLSFTIINLSSAIGAQANTLSDYELDLKDDRKKTLVKALDSFGQRRLRIILIIEFLATLALVYTFMQIQQKLILLFMWIVGISLGCIYSAPPIRLKSRSWLAPISLILVLAVFPVLFSYYTFASQPSTLFLVSVVGLALTVYGVIIPTEIRDYFGDKAMNIETMTVHLGLSKASLLSILLLSTGGTLMTTALFLELLNGTHAELSALALLIAIADIIVLAKFKKLHHLSKDYESSSKQSLAEDITNLSANNPKWIMLVTQTYSFLSIVLLVSKFLP
jgi:4-hydroxybenzoate polyprenyltransferase